MTAKEKAKELFSKYSTYVVMWTGGVETERQNVKQCALIAVEEIKLAFVGISHWEAAAYWRNVEQELEKL